MARSLARSASAAFRPAKISFSQLWESISSQASEIVSRTSLKRSSSLSSTSSTFFQANLESPSRTLASRHLKRGDTMRTILLIVLVLLLLGALPTWPYSAGWGYYPSGGLGLVLLIVVVLALSGRL